MDLLTSSLQAYEKHQNLAGWVSQTDQAVLDSDNTLNPELQDDAVSISGRHVVFDWIAQSHPHEQTQLANSGRVNQQLFDYGLIGMQHQAVLNQLTEQKPELPIIGGIEEALAESTSYQQTQHLQHLAQVFETLSAAQQSL